MTVAIDDVKRVLVVGAGQMGAQIAMQAALHGYAVTLNDLSAAILDKAMAGNRGHLDGVLSIKQAEGAIRAFVDK